jgi:3-phenylpropionate/trans-cinnamate dioxygenase ferredoxin subunit
MTRACSFDDLQDALPVRVVVDGKPVCLVRLGQEVHAVSDTCTHADVSLSEGEVDPDAKLIECWKHGSNFSLVTGEPDTLPAVVPVAVYAVRIESGDVEVEVNGG